MHICHVFPTFAAGGPQVRIAQIINSLPAGYSHTVVAIDGDTSARSRLSPSARVDFLDATRSARSYLYPIELGGRLRRLGADLLVTQNWGALDAVMSSPFGPRRRWIHMETGFNLDEAQRFKLRRTLTRRVVLRRAGAVVVPSQTLVDIARDRWGVRPPQLCYIPNGVDVERFAPGSNDSIRRSLGIGPDDVVVGTVANLRPVKDPLRLLEAFTSVMERYPGAHLMFVGDGDMRPPLEQRVDELGIRRRVHVIGHVEDVSTAHRCLDVFALSSRSEQCPVSLLEAMACGRPVLSTDVGDVKRLLAAPNRSLVTRLDDAAAYRGALCRLLEERELRAELGSANRRRAKDRYTLESMAAAYRALYERVALL